VDAWSERGPILFVVDDAHLADLASLRYLDRALAHVEDRALVVIKAMPESELGASARTTPDDEPAGFRSRIALEPLRKGALGRLAERWASGHPASERERITRLCEGDLSHLRELARRLDEGAQAVTGASRVDAARARIDRLGPEERRTLRAASIVGHEVAPSAIAVLLGVQDDDAALARRLQTLVAAGLVRQVATRSCIEQRTSLAPKRTSSSAIAR
jgi:predicted ATPase